MNIALSVAHHAQRHPDRVAVVEGGGRELTYGELRERSSQVANFLMARHGVGKGDRVAYLLLNCLEVPELLVGIIAAGGIAAPLNFRLGEDDLRAILGNAQPKVIICQPEFEDVTRTLAGELSADVVVLGEAYEGLLGATSPSAPRQMLLTGPNDDALIQYTSGTTGRPKGATFTHAATLAHAASVTIEYGLDTDSRVFVSIPHNSATNIQTIPALYRGCAVVFVDVRSFDGASWAKKITRLRATHTQVVPTMLYRLLEVHRRAPQLLPDMKRLGYGSAPIPPERVEELIGAFGSVFIQLYGMIETAAIGTMLRPHEHDWALQSAPRVLGSVGQPSYGIDVRVVDDELRDVPDGERGEIVFKGPYVMRGYWDAPDLTDQVMQEGWLRSGDVGVRRDGWLYIVDRIKDLIIRGGQNISSKEVEEAVYAHPAVMEAAVVGIPDAEWGESILAAVVKRPDAGDVTPDAIIEASAAEGLPRFKRPEHVLFMEELPRNAIGKIQKGRLRDMYRESGRSS